jgi:hypothetical protein
MSPSSKLSGRRHNAGTPKVTGYSKCPHVPAGHDTVVAQSKPVPPYAPGSTVTLTLNIWDKGRPDNDPFYAIKFDTEAGYFDPPDLNDAKNHNDFNIDWHAPDYEGTFRVSIKFTWFCQDSVWMNESMQVVAP